MKNTLQSQSGDKADIVFLEDVEPPLIELSRFE